MGKKSNTGKVRAEAGNTGNRTKIRPGLIVYDSAQAEPALVLSDPDAQGTVTILTSVGLATVRTSELKEVPVAGSALDTFAPHIAALFGMHESTRPFLREKQTVAKPDLERQMVELEQWRETARIIENVLPATTKKTGDYKSNIVFGVMKLATAYWSEEGTREAAKYHCDDPFSESRAKIGPFLDQARQSAAEFGTKEETRELIRLCEALTYHLSKMSLRFHRPIFTGSVGTLDGREYEVSSMSRVDLNALRDSMADVLGFAEDIFARAHTQAIATRDTGPRPA